MAAIETPPTAAPPAAPGIAVTPRAYGFLLFLMLLNVFNILDRQLLPTFANEIKADLRLTNGQFGLLSGIMFTLLYGVLSPFMGVIADTTHRPRFAAVGVMVDSPTPMKSRGMARETKPRVAPGAAVSALHSATPTAAKRGRWVVSAITPMNGLSTP